MARHVGDPLILDSQLIELTEDVVGITLLTGDWIAVVHPNDKFASVLARELVVDVNGLEVPKMEITAGFWRKSRANCRYLVL
jgi:hypothetical protein